MKKTIYWAVTAKCGHVGGLSKYIPITFYVMASSKKVASDYVISKPRVKHHNKGVIIAIENITLDDYMNGIMQSNNDPYLQCENIREQKYFLDEIYDRIIDEDDEWCIRKNARRHKIASCRHEKNSKYRSYRRFEERAKQHYADYKLYVA